MAISLSRPVEPGAESTAESRGGSHAIGRSGVLSGWRMVALVCVASAALAFLGFAISRSSVFHLRRLEITGTSHVSRTEIVRLSGLTKRTNVPWLDTASVQERIETDPWVAKATVSRLLPWTVEIHVEERRPVAAVLRWGRYGLVAADGTVLAMTGNDRGLPMIVPPPPRGVDASVLSPVGPARAIAALEPQTRALVRRVMVAPDGTLDLYLSGGLRVEYGAPTQVIAKTAAIQAVLQWAAAEGASPRSVNVLVPDSPSVTLAG